MRSCPRFGRVTMNRGCEYENSARWLSCTPQGDVHACTGVSANTCQDLECKSMSFPAGLRWRLLTQVRIDNHVELEHVSGCSRCVCLQHGPILHYRLMLLLGGGVTWAVSHCSLQSWRCPPLTCVPSRFRTGGTQRSGLVHLVGWC